MKQNKNTIVIALFAILSIATANAANTDDTITTLPLPVELKFAGTVKNQPLLQLNFSGSPAENEFRILVTDEAGYTLYSSIARGENFSKQFLLNTEDLGDAVLKFEITGLKTGNTVAYKVSRQQEVTQQMNLVKL